MLSFRLFNPKSVLVLMGILALLAAQPLSAQSNRLRGEEGMEDALPLIDTIIPLSEVLAQTSHEAALDSLFKTRLTYYQQHPSQGYSVLFFSAGGNNSRLAADQAEDEFRLLYPETPIYLSYEAPYYKLKAGSFRTRLEASAFLSKIQSSYPNAFVVREVLDVRYLLGIEEPELEEDITETESDNAESSTDDSFDF